MDGVLKRWESSYGEQLVDETRRLGWTVCHCAFAGRYFVHPSKQDKEDLVLEVLPCDSRFSRMMMVEFIMADWPPYHWKSSLLAPFVSLRITPFALIRLKPQQVLCTLRRHEQCDAGRLCGRSRVAQNDLVYIVSDPDLLQTTILMAEDTWVSLGD